MILVTGGAGYIGSHTVRALRKSGFETLIFDNLSTGHREFIGKTPFFEGDICNPADLERAFPQALDRRSASFRRKSPRARVSSES